MLPYNCDSVSGVPMWCYRTFVCRIKQCCSADWCQYLDSCPHRLRSKRHESVAFDRSHCQWSPPPIERCARSRWHGTFWISVAHRNLGEKKLHCFWLPLWKSLLCPSLPARKKTCPFSVFQVNAILERVNAVQSGQNSARMSIFFLHFPRIQPWMLLKSSLE